MAILASTAVMGIATFMFIDNATHPGGAATGAAPGYLSTRAHEPRLSWLLEVPGSVASLVLAGGAIFTIGRPDCHVVNPSTIERDPCPP